MVIFKSGCGNIAGTLYFLVSFLWMCFNNQANAQATMEDEPILSVQQLKGDFTVLRTSLEEIHPALYLYISKDSLDYYFNEADKKLDTPMTKDAFLRIVNPLFRKIYDEHTNIEVNYKYRSLQKVMPIKIRWVNGAPYLFKNLLNDTAFVLGSEVMSINGKKIQDLYDDMKFYYPPNGYTDPKLEYDMFSLNFDYIYASFYEQPDSFKIEVINPDTKEKYTHTSRALITNDVEHFIPYRHMSTIYRNKDADYTFTIEDNTALMTINAFNDHDRGGSGINYYKQLRHDFKSIKDKHVKNLVIDLRYCLGGEAFYAAELCSYLYDKPFTLYDTLYTSISHIPTYAQYTNWRERHWEREITALTQLHKNKKIKNDWTSSRDEPVIPKGDLFKGNIYVLINSDMHSTASIAAALLKQHTKATFVGVTVAGPYNSGCAMETITLTLPNTQMDVYIPLVRYLHSMPHNKFPYNHNLVPDVIVQPTIQDLLNNKDAVLDRVKVIINKDKKNIH